MVTRMTTDEALLKTSEDEERAKAEEALTLAINALRDIAESRRMPSGTEITEEVAARHRAAAGEFETLRRYMSAGGSPSWQPMSKRGKRDH